MSGREPGPRRVALSELAGVVGGTVVGDDIAVADIASPEEAGPADLALVATDRALPAAHASRAAALLVAHPAAGVDRPQLVAPHPAYAAACLVQRFFVAPVRPRGIGAPLTRGDDVVIGDDPSLWPFVTLGDRVRLGARVTLYPGVFVGDDVDIGDDCVLWPNAVVLARCRLGARVVVGPGTVIGSDGFGYVQHEGRHVKIPQRGGVVIEDDVEMGASVTIDRATYGDTVIGRGSKLDNQVHVAHNVTVGAHTILVAQVGIAGSTSVGSHTMIGGQAGLTDHIRVGDRVMIAAGAGVLGNVPDGGVFSGSPALPHGEALRVYGLLRRLPALHRELQDLRKRVDAIEAGDRGARRQRRPRPPA